jgi:hypothetical protein
MKTNRQKLNWILDALLFTGFLVSFALDLTGLPVHQWLGVFGGLLALYHLALHWNWVKTVTRRFFGKTSGQARTYYLLDFAIMFGFFLIVATGLVLSTWLNLALAHYGAWKHFHVTTSIVTLCLVVLKIGIHWRWIVRVARQTSFRLTPHPVQVLKPVPALQPVLPRVASSNAMTRRDFLKLMGIVGAASLAAISFTLNSSQSAQASSTASDSSKSNNLSKVQSGVTASSATGESVPVTEATPTAASEAVTVTQMYSPSSTSTTTTTTTSCTVLCSKHCPFPGQCRRYVDTNGNGYCDRGECS